MPERHECCVGAGTFGFSAGLRTRHPNGVRTTVSVSASVGGTTESLAPARPQTTSERTDASVRASSRIWYPRTGIAASGPGSWPGQSTARLNQSVLRVNCPAESRRTNSRSKVSGFGCATWRERSQPAVSSGAVAISMLEIDAGTELVETTVSVLGASDEPPHPSAAMTARAQRLLTRVAALRMRREDLW
jgi:hypothetical protein